MESRSLVQQPYSKVTCPQFNRRAAPLSARVALPRTLRSRFRVLARTSEVTADSKSKLKQKLYGLTRHVDLPPEEDRLAKETIAELEKMQGSAEPAGLHLTSTKWRSLYTTTKGNSAGQVGPFTGLPRQEFPAPGKYKNILKLGPFVELNLYGSYKQVSAEKIDLVFEDIHARLGPFNIKKDFPPGTTAWWRVSYSDEDVRIMYTNMGNIVVLGRDE